MKQKKVLTSIIAIALAGGLIFGGTFAWQSVSQTALNEVSAYMNPGGRLHDDFVDITYNEDGTQAYDTMTLNKDVYVENFTDLASNGVQVFARVRLDEYMELGPGAGLLSQDGKNKSYDNEAVSLVPGAKLEDKSSWTPHVYGMDNPDDPFHAYWDWELGGQTVYMPTFNKNKDSLEADINSYKLNGYTEYAENETRFAAAIYDADTADDGYPEVDELAEEDIYEIISTGNIDPKYLEKPNVRVTNEEHTAKNTINGGVISMEEWLTARESDPEWDGTGDFWVYDTDGWAYWANPVNPDTATGLLLNGIQRTEEIINKDWYYAINVVAQFVTADDMGQDDNTGFYDLAEGKAPSINALQLLSAIGVEVVETKVATTEELTAALEQGGIITLTDDVVIGSASLNVSKNTVLNLNGKTISNTADFYDGNSENSALIYVSGEDTTLIIDGGVIDAKAPESGKDGNYAVTVNDGATVIINGGVFKGGDTSAVYVRMGTANIYGGEFYIKKTWGDEMGGYKFLLNCNDDAFKDGTARINVYGGTFYDFDPRAEVETTEPYNYLAEGCGVEVTVGNTTAYKVVKGLMEDTATEASAQIIAEEPAEG